MEGLEDHLDVVVWVVDWRRVVDLKGGLVEGGLQDVEEGRQGLQEGDRQGEEEGQEELQ